MSGLKIYACSGVGEAADLDYWLNGTKTATNSQAVNYLLAKINYLNVTLKLYQNPEQIADVANELDFYLLALYCIDNYGNEPSELPRAGRILAHMYASGMFNLGSIDDDKRSENLDNLEKEFTRYMSMRSDFTDGAVDIQNWWNNTIIPASQTPALSPEKQKASEEFFAKSISGPTGDFSVYLDDAGSYFLYMYIPESEISKYPFVIRARRAKEIELYNYVVYCAKPLYGSVEAIDEIIYTGIVKKYNAFPEDVIKTLSTGSGIGVLGIDDIIAIIVAVAGLLGTIIAGVIDYCKVVAVAKYEVPADPDYGIAQDTDWTELDQVSNAKSLLKWGAIAAAAYLVIKKFL